jgi:carbon-monoxide dehydrogenase large subunit
MGCKRKRVEDVRFTQGKGSYVDDLKLPGMLFGDFVRSPTPMRASRASTRAAPRPCRASIAVLTAEDLKPLNLHGCRRWLVTCRWSWPTARCSSRTRKWPSSFAEDRYIAADAIRTGRGRIRGAARHRRSVQVDGSRRTGPARGHSGKMEGAHGPRKHHNHIFTWEIGDKEATDAVFANADVTIKEMLLSPHPSVTAGNLPVRGILGQGQG